MTLAEIKNQVICIDWIEGMKQLPDNCVHCVVTSPPYFGLRDYTTEGQLGLESTPEEYVEKLVTGFRELRRIMHPTGTVWLNMGDSYAGSGKAQGQKPEHLNMGKPQKDRFYDPVTWTPVPRGLKPKDLIEMPSRVVLALQKDGWWLRSRIPWLKRNAMPESTDDRPTQAVEYVFLLTKSGTSQFWTHPRKRGTDKKPKADYIWTHKRTGLVIDYHPFHLIDYKEFWKRSNLWRGHDYFYDGEAVRVKNSPKSIEWGETKKRVHGDGEKAQGQKGLYRVGSVSSGRSRRNSDWFFESWQGLWTDENGEPLAFIVNPKPYKQAHFATFPPGLVIPCLKAGTSEKGCCPDCGNPWVRIIERQKAKYIPCKSEWLEENRQLTKGQTRVQGGGLPVDQIQTLGWRPTCSCGKEPVACVAFDPFAGTGTVIQVARRMGRDGIGFDINPEYVKDFAGERLSQEVLKL